MAIPSQYHCELAANCLVCGLPLAGFSGKVLSWIGVGRSSRNPNCCTRCNTHIEEGRLAEITVLFADLSSFTAMTQKLGTELTYDIINEFLRLASGVLSRHGAFIDKYMGDAVMAFFNVPIKRDDHAAAAVAAAMELQEQLPGLSARRGVELRATVGIASGFARVGRLGSDDIKDYTAIGDAVNLAARLQSQARAGEVVVSRSVYEKVSALHPRAPAESLSLKGYEEPVSAYRLNSGSGALSPREWDSTNPRRARNWAALLLALLGAGCLSNGLANLLGLVFGVGQVASLWTITERIDTSPARVPILFIAAAMATANLFFLRRHSHPGGLHRRWNTASAVATLALVFVEIATHYHNDHVFW